ncbi:hypothetical protein [Tsukamurella paurometabola]|uniref:Lipoprotein n=1 Tax=Tsukamurella paurometabola TaxID=2061 RepID=A0A3P8KGU6_TSUPA|nr:hypothetical protein [Tsukamurella paurometabola]MBS4101137.1 hypothetical protein [Tsukamurella paurometabola]UEA82291.1 hypothetical protein LK411_18240 [Tsukamurella paurometabola]VDR39338.1 Uncharacterised protein [Tsukamurella paurometabola]
MTGRTRIHPFRGRGGAALAAGVSLLALAGCGSVSGTGSADPQDVAAYQSTIASSRAAAAAAAGKSACASWQSGYDVRVVASRATVNFTKDPKWTWEGITGLLNAEFAAITTETNKLPGIIATENLAPTIKTSISDYKTKLDAYSEALRADQSARGSGDATWSRSNPAFTALNDAATAVKRICT